MDYSLLLAVEKNVKQVRDKLTLTKLSKSSNGDYFNTTGSFVSAGDKNISNSIISASFSSAALGSTKKKSSLKIKEYE